MDEKFKEELISFLMELVETDSKFSINRLQSKLYIGFTRACRIKEFLLDNNIMSEDGFVIANESHIKRSLLLM